MIFVENQIPTSKGLTSRSSDIKLPKLILKMNLTNLKLTITCPIRGNEDLVNVRSKLIQCRPHGITLEKIEELKQTHKKFKYRSEHQPASRSGGGPSALKPRESILKGTMLYLSTVIK